jgi:adenosine deaminase
MAEKNNAVAEFIKLKEVREEFNNLVAQESAEGVHDKSIALIWTQFALIHKIMKTLADIQQGTVAAVLRYALKKDIGVAIHIGEADTKAEMNDVDIILNVLTSWSKQINSGNPFQGKVRLGHGIFLTEGQRATIKALQLPIEVCPSCHEKLNWWNKSKPHPVTHIYQIWKDPVVVGTDDEMIFGGNVKEENHTVLEMLGYPKDEKADEAMVHQSKFRFAN